MPGSRYGEGTLYTKNYPPLKVYWQGPSLGYDFGGDGAKVMTLVYNLQYTPQIFERFAGVDGSAYLVGGVGMTFLQRDDIILGAHSRRRGVALGSQCRLSEIYTFGNLEPVLGRLWAGRPMYGMHRRPAGRSGGNGTCGN